jgi:hypothetical protein
VPYPLLNPSEQRKQSGQDTTDMGHDNMQIIKI